MNETLRTLLFSVAFLVVGFALAWLVKPNPPPTITVKETVVIDSTTIVFQARQIDSLRGTTKKAVALVSQAVRSAKDWKERADALQESVDSMKAGAAQVPSFVSTLDTSFAVVEDSGDVRMSGPRDTLRVSHAWPVDVWRDLFWKPAPRSAKLQTIIREIEKAVEVDKYPIGFMGVLVVVGALVGFLIHARIY